MANAKKDDNYVNALIAVSSADGETPVRLEANPATGELLTSSSAAGTLVTESFDYVGAAYPDAVTEVYTYKLGGAAGVTVATVTVGYTSSDKSAISAVAKT